MKKRVLAFFAMITVMFFVFITMPVTTTAYTDKPVPTVAHSTSPPATSSILSPDINCPLVSISISTFSAIDRAGPPTVCSTYYSYALESATNYNVCHRYSEETLTTTDTSVHWFANIGYTKQSDPVSASSSVTSVIWRPGNDMRDRPAAIAFAVARGTLDYIESQIATSVPVPNKTS